MEASLKNNSLIFIDPESLKLTCQVALIKLVHETAFRLENNYGDKSSKKNSYFIRGIQGKVSRPCWNRDYSYLVGQIKRVRKYVQENSSTTVSRDLFDVAFQIFDRYENRRRMGGELIVLTILATSKIETFRLPHKYSRLDIKEMVSSIRYKIQNRELNWIWSNQSECVLDSVFSDQQYYTNITQLFLPMCNDDLLISISVNIPHLIDFRFTPSINCTEEGLLAIAGLSTFKYDQGQKKRWDNGLYLSPLDDLDSFIKDCFLFLQPPKVKREMLERKKKLPQMYKTGFGCLKLKTLHLYGSYIFPPFITSFMGMKYKLVPPILELGIYSLLIGLPKLDEFKTKATSLAVSKLSKLYDREIQLNIKNLIIEDEERLTFDDMINVAQMCPNIRELYSIISWTCLSVFQLKDIFPPRRPLVTFYEDSSPLTEFNWCSFLLKMSKLETLSFSFPLPCVSNYLMQSINWEYLTKFKTNTLLHRMSDLIVFRQVAQNLITFECQFEYVVSMNAPYDNSSQYNYIDHRHSESNEINFWSNRCIYEEDLKSLKSWDSLRKVVLIGPLNVRVTQIIIANAPNLEVLEIESYPDELSNNGLGLSDEWLSGIINVNPFVNLRQLTLKLDDDKASVEIGDENRFTVEAGSFSKTGLVKFLNQAKGQCFQLERMIGEFTRIPDKELMELQSKFIDERKITCKVGKGIKFEIKNSLQYRPFQRPDDNDRYYGMNEGYLELMGKIHVNPVSNNHILKNKRIFGYVYKPEHKNNND